MLSLPIQSLFFYCMNYVILSIPLRNDIEIALGSVEFIFIKYVSTYLFIYLKDKLQRYREWKETEGARVEGKEREWKWERKREKKRKKKWESKKEKESQQGNGSLPWWLWFTPLTPQSPVLCQDKAKIHKVLLDFPCGWLVFLHFGDKSLLAPKH